MRARLSHGRILFISFVLVVLFQMEILCSDPSERAVVTPATKQPACATFCSVGFLENNIQAVSHLRKGTGQRVELSFDNLQLELTWNA